MGTAQTPVDVPPGTSLVADRGQGIGLSPVSVSGYLAELVRRPRRW
jgi:hypothetical protein